jgi:hypothetical protein
MVAGGAGKFSSSWRDTRAVFDPMESLMIPKSLEI